MKADIPEDQDPAWALLKSARPVEVDPFFSRNVVRAVRQNHGSASDAAPWWRQLFAPRWQLAWAAVLVLSGLAYWQHLQPGSGIARNVEPGSLTIEIGARDVTVGEMASELALLDEIDGLLEVTEAGELIEDDVGVLLF